MRTLVELFDDSPIFNILASVAFKPQKVIFLGADRNKAAESKNDYRHFFSRRNEKIDIEYISTDTYDVSAVFKSLETIIRENDDCVVDVTGGKDIALLAAGMAAVKLNVPLIAYNKRTGKYSNISRFRAAEEVDINGLLDCHDFFAASGGRIIEFEDFSAHKEDAKSFWNTVLKVWDVYLKNMKTWAAHVQYLQRVTPPTEPDGSVDLNVMCPPCVHVNGKELRRNDSILTALNDIGAIVGLKMQGNSLKFSYCNREFRHYLTDVGAFLELYIHACALKSQKFTDVLSRVKYHWEYNNALRLRTTIFRPASNEIDVIAVCGIEPLFISCKTSVPDMKHIDEIYPQAMRMSGGEGHAVYACTHPVDIDMPLYNKAKALGVYIIDGDDISNRLVPRRLSQIADGSYIWKDEPEYAAMIKENQTALKRSD